MSQADRYGLRTLRGFGRKNLHAEQWEPVNWLKLPNQHRFFLPSPAEAPPWLQKILYRVTVSSYHSAATGFHHVYRQ